MKAATEIVMGEEVSDATNVMMVLHLTPEAVVTQKALKLATETFWFDFNEDFQYVLKTYKL